MKTLPSTLLRLTAFFVALMAALLNGIGMAQTTGTDQKFLRLTPDLAGATLNEGHGKIPFTVKNISDEDVVFTQDWRIVVHLMITDASGNALSIEDFQYPLRTGLYSGPGPEPIVLKPGETGKYDSQFFMETLAFVAGKNKKIFGGITGYTAKTNQVFNARSDSLAIPPDLTKPPWDDLGTQSYLSVTVDATRPHFQLSGSKNSSRSQYWAFLTFPIKITNTTHQPLLVNSDHIEFFKTKQERKSEPDLWELVMGMHPVPGPSEMSSRLTLLKPGESVQAGGRSYIIMWNNLPDEWKKGDPLFVGVAGRIPDTNKVFESYSAPFGFPAEPDTN